MFWILNILVFMAAFSMVLAAFYLVLSRTLVRERLQAISQIGVSAQGNPFILSFYDRVIKPVYERGSSALGNMAPHKIKAGMERIIQHAGMARKFNANGLMAIQVFSGLGLFFIGFIISGLTGIIGGNILFAFLLGILGLFLPLFIIYSKAESRKSELEKSLPDFLDMLYVSVEAGLGFDMALKRVAEQMPGPMAEEFKRTLEEINAGRPREEALRNIIKRTGVQDLSTFVSSVIQTEQLGSNIGNTLRTQADYMRTRRKQRAEESAMKAPVKMLFPIVIFIFPALFVVILGPAVISIIETLFDII